MTVTANWYLPEGAQEYPLCGNSSGAGQVYYINMRFMLNLLYQ